MYSQSSLRIQHLNYFNHVLELFKLYLSKDFKLKINSIRELIIVIVPLILLHYHCHVLITIEIYFIIQIICSFKYTRIIYS